MEFCGWIALCGRPYHSLMGPPFTGAHNSSRGWCVEELTHASGAAAGGGAARPAQTRTSFAALAVLLRRSPPSHMPSSPTASTPRRAQVVPHPRAGRLVGKPAGCLAWTGLCLLCPCGGRQAGQREGVLCHTQQASGGTKSALSPEGGYIARTPAKPIGEGNNRQGYTGAPTEIWEKNHSCGTDGREEIKEWAHASAHPQGVQVGCRQS